MNGVIAGRIMMVKSLLLAAASALLSGGAVAQEEEGRPFMRDWNGNVVHRGGLVRDEDGDFVYLALDPAGDEEASNAARRAGLVLSPAGALGVFHEKLRLGRYDREGAR